VPNWLVIGESAAMVDPMTSNGVTAALRHAVEAARLVVRNRDRKQLPWLSRTMYSRRVLDMANFFNSGIEKVVYDWPIRNRIGPLTAGDVYTIPAWSINNNQDISLHRLAAEFGLSARHFTRAFRQSTVLSPHRWLIQHRVERARELLADRRLSLTEFALICGFADQSHFTRSSTAIIGSRVFLFFFRLLNGSLNQAIALAGVM
jgi:AraC-like DNA-binding protein